MTLTVVMLGIYFSGNYAYVLFRGLVEVVSIAIAFAMFVLVWNTRTYIANNFLCLLGIGYAFNFVY
ncbi:MAG TPA: MASE3 domain-containing protein, partial [Bacteroidota bacterium]|nr:MASE3 domain-containing protein [Bacteroidota bacterium]